MGCVGFDGRAIPATGRSPRRRRRRRRGRGGRAGFTLLELLIVVGVIGVLAGVLLPALVRAKGRAQRLECQSRMKQWGQAFRSYAEDHDGWIPRECYEPLGEVTINNWSQVKGRRQPDGTSDSQDVWYNALPPELDQPPAVAFAAPADRPGFHDSRRMIHCPAARFPSQAFRSTFQFPLFSVAMNSQLIQSGPSIRLSAMEQRDPARTV